MLTYRIDNVDIYASYGIIVTGSTGVIDAPKMKKPFGVNVSNSHGEQVDLTERFFEPKEITFRCAITANSNYELTTEMQSFKSMLLATGKRTLSIDIGTYPLIFIVYCSNGIEIDKIWRESGKVHGTFTLKLVEPEPYKIVLRSIVPSGGYNLVFGASVVNPINIYWGDGTAELGYIGNSITKSFPTAGTYYTVITGYIDSLTSLEFMISEGTTIIWNKLL